MFCKLISYCLNGIETLKITVEIDLSSGLPGFEIVGLPDSAVRESKERVKSAIKNSGFQFPISRITVNLAPADVKKEGSMYDLPIAVGILCATGIIPPEKLATKLLVGELALDGAIRPIRGIIPLICAASSDHLSECLSFFPPLPTFPLENMTVLKHFNHLRDLMAYLCYDTPPQQLLKFQTSSPSSTLIDFSDVKGQERVKKSLIVAAAGHHHTIMIGPPGSGKTMLARRLPHIFPKLSHDELLEVNKIYSITQHQGELLTDRPFRSPHHSVSTFGLTGGTMHCKPGEISLAHRGVLFLDELLEFNRQVLEVLRQPLEEGSITISRASQSVTYPANFLLIASTNPCPCGHYPNEKKCNCDFPSIKKYLRKLSGPLLERIDIHIETNSVSLSDFHESKCLSSKDMYNQVQTAYLIQNHRYQEENFHYNSEIPVRLIGTYCPLDSGAKKLLEMWFESSTSSMRSYHRVIRLSRTIADLENSPTIKEDHMAQAIDYRILDHKFWA